MTLLICLFSGVVIRPHAIEIFYNRTDPAMYKDYVNQLDNFLKRE